ncbi:hypothetical protein [Psychrobacter sp. BF1]|uniref:hypothetical protein n=2 Tax=Moraxellaceae TaxID=468 RepID=UPI001C4E1E67|nr:hypothetical protein [Psychrobacter sp. BF1]
MPGQHITHRQEELYMQHRQQGMTQEIAEYDLTAKVSQGDSPSDKPGVVEGLKQRIRAYNFSKQRTSSIAVI